MNIRKMLEEVEPVICDDAPEPTVYDMLVFYYLQFSAFSKAEAHRCASKYIDELLKLVGSVEPTNGSAKSPMSAEEEASLFWSMLYEASTGKPKGDCITILTD
jgi:hypothetical protein